MSTEQVTRGAIFQESSLNALLAAEQPRLIRWLRTEWNAKNYDITDAQIARAVRTGKIPPAWPDAFTKKYAEFVNKRMGPVWAKAYGKGTKALTPTAKRWAEKASTSLMQPGLDRFVLQRGGEMITSFSKSQHRAFQKLLRHYTKIEPVGEKELARMIRGVVGLRPKQVQWLIARRTALVAQGVTGRKLDTTIAKNATKWRHQRALLIARTELATAYNQGVHDGVVALHEAGAMESVVRRWWTQVDERVCPFCGPLHDRTSGGLDTPFESLGSLTNVPPLHPGCRCLLLYETQAFTPASAAASASVP